MKSFSDCTIQEYLESLGSTRPAPGGGSASAVQAALGAALLVKVASISEIKLKISLVSEIEKAKRLEKSFMQVSDEDAAAYTKVVAAYQAKAISEDEKRVKRERIDQELELAFDIPLGLIQLLKTAEVLRKELLAKCSGSIASDLDVAGLFFEAAMKSAHHLAEGNLACIKKTEIQSELKERLEAAQ